MQRSVVHTVEERRLIEYNLSRRDFFFLVCFLDLTRSCWIWQEAYFDDDAGYQPIVEIAADPQRVQSQSADANAKDACDSMRE